MNGPLEETGMGDIPEANNIKIIKKLPGGWGWLPGSCFKSAL